MDPEMAEDLKLLSTVAAKVSEKTARRIRAIGLATGLSDGQVARLILDRAMELFEHWDPSINPRYFLSKIQISEQQLNLFSLHREGFERLERLAGSCEETKDQTRDDYRDE
jgi:hypothetical protein